MIGNLDTLKADPTWKKWLDWAEDEGLVIRGPVRWDGGESGAVGSEQRGPQLRADAMEFSPQHAVGGMRADATAFRPQSVAMATTTQLRPDAPAFQFQGPSEISAEASRPDADRTLGMGNGASCGNDDDDDGHRDIVMTGSGIRERDRHASRAKASYDEYDDEFQDESSFNMSAERERRSNLRANVMQAERQADAQMSASKKKPVVEAETMSPVVKGILAVLIAALALNLYARPLISAVLGEA